MRGIVALVLLTISIHSAIAQCSHINLTSDPHILNKPDTAFAKLGIKEEYRKTPTTWNNRRVKEYTLSRYNRAGYLIYKQVKVKKQFTSEASYYYRQNMLDSVVEENRFMCEGRWCLHSETHTYAYLPTNDSAYVIRHYWSLAAYSTWVSDTIELHTYQRTDSSFLINKTSLYRSRVENDTIFYNSAGRKIREVTNRNWDKNNYYCESIYRDSALIGTSRHYTITNDTATRDTFFYKLNKKDRVVKVYLGNRKVRHNYFRRGLFRCSFLFEKARIVSIENVRYKRYR